MPERPYCRTCGKPIAKKTETHWFGCDMSQPYNQGNPRMHAEKPKTRAEAQRYVNQQIVSLRRSRGEEDYVSSVNIWDGESYYDEHFCGQSCAAGFGWMMAREHPTVITQRAADAAKARTKR